jgi:type IV pilus assembly protein PilY1
MLYIGSGNRAHPLDKANIDYLYGIKDRNQASALTVSDLVNLTDGLLMTGSEAEKDAIKANLESMDGWYIVLENTGEKSLAPPLVFGGVVYYATFEPDATAPVDPCAAAASLGTARLYALDYKTGNAVYNFDESNAALEKSDRSLSIGGSIPSGVVIGMIDGIAIAKVGVDGTVPTVTVVSGSGLYSTFWRYMY